MKLLDGKVAIITGASRGIGSGIAKVFAEQGANVAFTYSSSAESALVLENELNALGIKAKGYKSNAADFNEAQKLVEDVMAEFGNVDVLINNAGITKDNLLMRMSEEDFDKVQAELDETKNLNKGLRSDVADAQAETKNVEAERDAAKNQVTGLQARLNNRGRDSTADEVKNEMDKVTQKTLDKIRSEPNKPKKKYV